MPLSTSSRKGGLRQPAVWNVYWDWSPFLDYKKGSLLESAPNIAEILGLVLLSFYKWTNKFWCSCSLSYKRVTTILNRKTGAIRIAVPRFADSHKGLILLTKHHNFGMKHIWLDCFCFGFSDHCCTFCDEFHSVTIGRDLRVNQAVPLKQIYYLQ